MTQARRVPPDEVHRRMQEGDTLLVCAYDDEEKCREKRLEGAISLHELESRLPDLRKDRHLVFY